MDELQKAWQKLQEKQFANAEIKKETIIESIYKESHSPLMELKKRTKYKLYWIIFFAVVNTTALLLTLHNLDYTLILSVFEVYLLASLAYTLYQVNKIVKLSLSEDLKHVVKEYYKRVKTILHFEESIALIFMPIAALGGGFIGAMYKGGVPLEEVIQRPKLLLTLIVVIIIYTPIGYFAAKWGNRKVYGSYLKQLEGYIQQMESKE